MFAQASVWRASLSHYRRHPLQLVALLLIIVLATALWSGVWDLTRQARHSLTQGSHFLAGLNEVTRQDGQAVTVTDYVRLRRAGVCVAPWLEVTPASGRGRRIGIDGLSLGCFAASGQQRGDRFSGEPFIDIAEAVRQQQAPGAEWRFRLMTTATAGTLQTAYRVEPAERRLDTGELADSFLLNLDALCVLVLLITGLLVRSVYLLGLSQRQAGFLLLHRFGVSRRHLQRVQLTELAIIAVLGSLPGTLLGLLLARAFAQGFGRVLGGLFDVAVFEQSLSWMAFVPVLVTTGLVMLWSLFDQQQSAPETGPFRTMTVVGGLALLTGLAGLVLAPGLGSAFAALALVFLGVGVLTPRALSHALQRWSARSQRPLRIWSLRELSVMVRRLGLPVVALQFAAATVIAIQALVTTFETTFYVWLDQRLQGDMYVELADNRQLPRVASELNTLPGIRQWHAVQRDRAQLTDPGPARIDLLAVDPASPLLRRWHFLDAVAAPWDAVARGQVMINEQLARRYDLQPGDTLSYGVAGLSWTPTVAAIYPDYGRPSGELLMAASRLPAGFHPGFTSLTLALEPTATTTAIQAALSSGLPGLEFRSRDNATVRGLATRVFEQTFLLTRAISLFTLILAGVSLLLLGWVFFGTRRWYFHLLRVWGVSRLPLQLRISGLSVSVTLLATLAALPLGVVMTWVLVARINPLAFGWSLPMAVYPWFWLQLILASLAIGLVIAWLIQRQLGESPPQPVTVSQLQGVER